MTPGKLRRWAFTGMTYLVLAFGLLFGPYLVRNPIAIALAFMIGSFVIYNLLTKLFGHFWSLNRHEEYPSFYYGNLAILPLTVGVPLALLASHVQSQSSGWYGLMNHWWWVAAILAGAFASGFRYTQKQSFPKMALNSPWKLWHDLFDVTFLAFLLILDAPAMFISRWGLVPLFEGHWNPGVLLVPLALAGVTFWFYVGLKLDRKMDTKAPNGPRVRVFAFDWETMTTIGPLLMGILKGDIPLWTLP